MSNTAEVIRRALANGPAERKLRYAKELFSKNRYKDSAQEFRELIALLERIHAERWVEPDAYYGLGLALWRRGKASAADKAEALKAWSRALVLAKRGAWNVDTRASHSYNVGTCYADCGRHEEAVKLYRQALRLNRTLSRAELLRQPDSSRRRSRHFRFLVIHQLCSSYVELGRKSTALTIAKRTVREAEPSKFVSYWDYLFFGNLCDFVAKAMR